MSASSPGTSENETALSRSSSKQTHDSTEHFGAIKLKVTSKTTWWAWICTHDEFVCCSASFQFTKGYTKWLNLKQLTTAHYQFVKRLFFCRCLDLPDLFQPGQLHVTPGHLKQKLYEKKKHKDPLVPWVEELHLHEKGRERTSTWSTSEFKDRLCIFTIFLLSQTKFTDGFKIASPHCTKPEKTAHCQPLATCWCPRRNQFHCYRYHLHSCIGIHAIMLMISHDDDQQYASWAVVHSTSCNFLLALVVSTIYERQDVLVFPYGSTLPTAKHFWSDLFSS